MLAYAVRRLVVAVPVVLAATFVVFLLVSLSGDPLADLKGRNPPPSAQVISGEEQRLHLDEPLVQRYWTWISGVATGDFGPSVRTNVDIGHEIATRVGVTFRLITLAVLLALLLAVVVGVLSAVKQYSRLDYGFTFLAFLFLSMPSFWFAILLKEAGISLNGLVGDQVGVHDRGGVRRGRRRRVGAAGRHLRPPRPADHLTGPVSFAAWSRFQRASMLDVLNSDYVRFARAKGLSRRRVVVRHALRTALIPMTTVMALDFATRSRVP